MVFLPIVPPIVVPQEGLLETTAGAGFAVAANYAYIGLSQGVDPVPGVEHETWGLAALLLASKVRSFKWFGLGTGATLILQKVSTADPLDTDLTPTQQKLKWGLDALLGGAVIMAASRR